MLAAIRENCGEPMRCVFLAVLLLSGHPETLCLDDPSFVQAFREIRKVGFENIDQEQLSKIWPRELEPIGASQWKPGGLGAVVASSPVSGRGGLTCEAVFNLASRQDDPNRMLVMSGRATTRPMKKTSAQALVQSLSEVLCSAALSTVSRPDGITTCQLQGKGDVPISIDIGTVGKNRAFQVEVSFVIFHDLR